ncbi:MAG: AAA family ATPase [Candidatus Wallbacteria bacterium HGW-Wallbacteria-1]|jgi:uridine kinase|uniref:AAA family ATPase n=1 Tax=Candidatus Wallbacteria bacterium HGW-Wallbacteria-1 TaxID=2013854 RepID=A0A2N1PRD1_9BACT|nr:MAG: AAA family ATPase [Candidatus Wallbacteria bacterium HGW-Wallbacteria-1]
MSSSVTLTFSDGQQMIIEKGTLLRDVLAEKCKPSDQYPVIAAKVNNKLYSLDYYIDESCKIEPITFLNKEGKEIYRRSTSLILRQAAWELYRNTRLVVGHSLGNGYYYDYYSDTPVSERTCEALKAKMKEIIQRNIPITRTTLPIDEARSLLENSGQIDKVRLVRHIPVDKVGICRMADAIDLDNGPHVPYSGCIKTFDLRLHYPGFILRFPFTDDYRVELDLPPQKKLFQVYQESKSWAKILEVNNVGRLNDIIGSGDVSDFIKVSEVFHDYKFGEIASEISKKRDSVRVILIAGPSSSGKTTFSKRLSIHLRVNGLRPIALSLDDYFVNREDCPRDETGDYDFESIDALDVPLFNEHLKALLEGRVINMPKFCFEKGCRETSSKLMSIDESQMIIIEGIHGLNPRLTEAIADENKFRIYVSALTSLNIDDHNRIPTTDTRIIRRIVRDHKFRSYDVRATIQRWASVRRGEDKNIFPYQENADVMFNSAQAYELSVLKIYAEPLLKSIQRNEPEYNEAKRLRNFLRLFKSLDPDEVPPCSILREFIGNSAFKY